MPQVGLRDLYYAIMNDDETYQAPKKIAGAITANISPTVNSATLYADDGAAETATAMGDVSVDLNVKDIPTDAHAELLGHTVDANGVLTKKSTDVAPYVAIGFRSEKSNGKFRYVWLHKGKFRPPEQSYETKQDSPAFQTPTISGTFVRRDTDNQWQAVADEDDAALDPTVITNWFNAVYIGSIDTTAPTVSSTTPIDSATGVAVDTTVQWVFSEAIRESDVTGANFFVLDDTGAEVSGTLSISVDKTTVTFTPAANLAALTTYTAVATKNVRDIAGNAMAANHVITFTTA